jgi:peroxiredoxin Q/BCP
VVPTNIRVHPTPVLSSSSETNPCPPQSASSSKTSLSLPRTEPPSPSPSSPAKPSSSSSTPRADTPGCTIEACEFRDSFPKFNKLKDLGVVILGLSRDTSKAQKKFAEKFNLPYTLLADSDQKVIESWNLLREKTMYGKPVTGVARTTYLIGPDRKLLHIFEKVKPEGHAEEVLAFLKSSKT